MNIELIPMEFAFYNYSDKCVYKDVHEKRVHCLREWLIGGKNDLEIAQEGTNVFTYLLRPCLFKESECHIVRH